MAGGKGTRLRPLTCQLPKPMVPLLQKPVMQYSIELLKKHGITDIAVTVQYLPDEIRDYFGDGEEFGVRLTYFEEIEPLGTAGSVKQAEEFLNEPFVVVSGDALTDFDLQAGIKFHEQNDALVSIFMKQVACPLEFGVIMTNQDDEIVRFLEKPSLSEVFSDTVNTGIYVMDPSIFSYIEEGKSVDFSKDVFPRLLEEKAGMYGYAADGYWSDIGNLEQYRQAHMDILNRDVKASIMGIEVEPGIFVDQTTTIEEGAVIEAPSFIGKNSTVRKHAKVGPYSVVGSNTIISEEATIKRSVVWNGVFVGRQSELRGVTICDGVKMGAKSSAYEQAVIGRQSEIGEEASIQPGMKIWPHKRIAEGAVVSDSVVWNDQDSITPLLNGHRAIGVANVEVTPEHVSRLGAAFASTLAVGGEFVLSGDHQAFTKLLKLSFAQSVQATGVDVVDLDEAALPVLRKTIADFQFAGGAHIRVNQDQHVVIEFFDHQGLPITSSLQKELEKIVTFSTYRRVAFDQLGSYNVNTHFEEIYVKQILSFVDNKVYKHGGISVAIFTQERTSSEWIALALRRLGCQVETSIESFDLDKIALEMTMSDADIGIILGETGEFITLVTPEGHIVTDEEKLVLFVDMHLAYEEQEQIAIPLYGGSTLIEYVRSHHKEVIRTKASARDMMMAEENVQLYCFDGLYAATHLIYTLLERNQTLDQYVNTLPRESLVKQEVSCRSDQKGMVMRALMETLEQEDVELIEGMRVSHPEGGWTYIVPDQNEPVFTVYAQADEPEMARLHANYYIDQIHQLVTKSTFVHSS